MRYLRVNIVGLLLLLTACSHTNPALQVDADTFATMINHFEPGDSLSQMNHAAICGAYFADPSTFKKEVVLINPDDPRFQQDCKSYANHLADFLNQYSQLQMITAKDLMQPETWQHYFESRQARGRGRA